jgi:titin
MCTKAVRFILVIALLCIIQPVQPSHAAAIVVDTTSDMQDAAADCASVTVASLPGYDGVISLREAICAAVNNPGEDTITFDLNCLWDVCTIKPDTTLPWLTGGGTTIDGGGTPANPDEDQDAAFYVQIDGSNLATGDGFVVVSANNTIKGLLIHSFPDNGVFILGDQAYSNTISGNYIGTEETSLGELGNGLSGVSIDMAAHDNLIGGDTPSERNVISNNGASGVSISGQDTTGNIVSGNYIGTDDETIKEFSNAFHGVHIYNGAHHNTVGGDSIGERNLISGNGLDGVRIEGENADYNAIIGNYIGTTYSGDEALGNSGYGVHIAKGAQNNTISKGKESRGNVICANVEGGVSIAGAGTMSNTVSANNIGIQTDDLTILGPQPYGVRIWAGAQGNTIGSGNIISRNNLGIAIQDSGTDNNLVVGNKIGTDSAGINSRGNYANGVVVSAGAQDNIIGGDTTQESNLISANGEAGVAVIDQDTDGNIIAGNFIGTDISGRHPLGNASNGIFVGAGTQDTLIGGYTGNAGNIITDNHSGINMECPPPRGTTIANNFIGTAFDGRTLLGNHYYGIYLGYSGRESHLDSTQPASIQYGVYATLVELNIIAGNVRDGVYIGCGDHNFISQNSIFSNLEGITVDPAANGGILPPLINATLDGSLIIQGKACAGCTVELFENRDDDGEGETYIGQAITDGGGIFQLELDFIHYPYLTATASDDALGTSMFSEVFTATTMGIETVFIPFSAYDLEIEPPSP